MHRNQKYFQFINAHDCIYCSSRRQIQREYSGVLAAFHSGLTLCMLGNFLKIDYIVVCFLKPLNSAYFVLEMMD